MPSCRYCFSCLGCRAILRFSPAFLILAAIFLPCHFHHCRPIYRCSASNVAAFHSKLDLELLFLLWFCRRHIHFATKDVFVVTTGRRPVPFFAFLVVIILVIFTPSCCSYCHCSTGSNSHTVVLSKPASYSPALFSVPVKIREHAYQSFMVVSRYGKYGYSTLVGAVKVRLRYGGSTREVRRKYGKSTVKYSKITVLYGNFFLAPTVSCLNLSDS